MDQQDVHQFLTVDEAAETKGVTRAAVYLAVSQGRLPSRRIMGRIALAAPDVAAWTPTPNSGRPKGVVVTDQARSRMSEAQKKRWSAKSIRKPKPL